MRPPGSTKRGFVLLVGSLVVSLVRIALPTLWGAGLPASGSPAIFGQSVRGFWVPAIGYAVDGLITILGILGFAMLWRGRHAFGAAYARTLRLGLFALIGGAVVLGIWFAAGVLLGYVSGLTYLVPWRRVLVFVATVFLGLALFWGLGYLPYPGMKAVTAITLGLGVAGGALALLAAAGLRRTEAATLRGAGEALSVVSLVLWLAVCAWGWAAQGSRGTGPTAAAPSQSP